MRGYREEAEEDASNRNLFYISSTHILPLTRRHTYATAHTHVHTHTQTHTHTQLGVQQHGSNKNTLAYMCLKHTPSVRPRVRASPLLAMSPSMLARAHTRARTHTQGCVEL